MPVAANSTYTVTRNKTIIIQKLPVELQPSGTQEQSDEGGAGPYMLYDGYIQYVPPTLILLQGDLLIDEQTLDPITNGPVELRIVNDPYVWSSNRYCELSCKHYRGN